MTKKSVKFNNWALENYLSRHNKEIRNGHSLIRASKKLNAKLILFKPSFSSVSIQPTNSNFLEFKQNAKIIDDR